MNDLATTTAAPASTPSLKRDGAWTAADTLVSAGLAFLFRLVIARFVAPAEFGVFALALTTFAIVQVINEFGMAATVIQRSADRFTTEVIDTAFAASTLVSTGLFIINLLVIAPLSAWAYDSHRIGLVTAVIGVSFLFTPTVSIARALLFRQRDYRAVTIARIVSTLLSIVVAGIVLVLFRNVWALVVQIVSSQIFLAVAMYRVGEWRPRFRLSRGAFREMIGYSGLVFANDAFDALAKNLDVFVLGRMLTQNQVGLYSLAFYITDVVRLNLASILNRVMFTHYASLQNDMAGIRRNALVTLSFNALVMLPLMLAIILAGPSLLPLVLGSAWLQMGPTLQLLALAVIFSALGGTTSTIFKALGRPGLEFAITVGTSTVLLAPALIVGVLYFGIKGAAAAIAFKVLISMVIRQILLERLVGGTLLPVLKTAAGSLLVQVPLLGVWLLITRLLDFDTAINALIALACGVPIYAVTLLAVRRSGSNAWPALRQSSTS